MRLKKYGLRIKDLFFAVVVSLMFFMSSNFVFGDEIEINEPLGLYKNVYEASYEKIANKESAGNTEVSKEAPFEENTKTENNDFVLNQKNF